MARRWLAVWTGIAATVAAAAAWADEPPNPCADDCRVHVGITPYYRVGQVSGDLQTGRGGGAGTTSPQRPTLEEIGVQLGHEAGVDVQVRYRRHEVVLGASALVLFGDKPLQDTLISQDETFPAGTGVESDTYVMFGRAAYRYRLCAPLFGERFAVRPGLGVSMFNFHYQLDGDNGASTDREYSHFAPHVELGLAWRPQGQGPVWFSADLRQTLTFLLPDSNQTNLFEGVLRIHYDVARNWSFHVETGFRHFSFQDDQPVPNDPDVDFGPWIGIGINARF